jgi:hypothetical protein
VDSMLQEIRPRLSGIPFAVHCLSMYKCTQMSSGAVEAAAGRR